MSGAPVLVLGARSDIARALAAAFAGEGRPLMLAGRDEDALERDRADMALRYKVDVSAHRLDVLDIGSYGAFLDSLDPFPGVVISAVGLLGDQDENARNPEEAQKIIATNFTGPALLLEAAAARLAEQSDETGIIGISSVAGDRGRAQNYVYGAAKAGLSEYLSGMRQKYVRSRLHIMTVKPGFVRTAMTEGMDLPGPLTTTPEALAGSVMKAFKRKRMVYYDFRWWAVMGVIKMIPEKIFSRMKF